MSDQKIPEEQIKAVSKEVVASVLEQVATALRGQDAVSRSQVAHACTSKKFDCTEKYHCTGEDSCSLEINCPEDHTCDNQISEVA